jgi:hypothetical protein
MSDHDFEKQVNQKLEELKLRPSDTVWMEVEKNIRQHKRRRRFLWLWTAALFITLTTSGVVLYHYTSDTRITTEMVQAKPAELSNEPASVSHNSTNTNSTNKQATTVHSVPGNASSNPNNETVQSIQPTENNQPGTTPPAAPVTNLPVEKQPAIALIQKSANKETIGNNNKKQVQKPLTYVTNDNMPEPGITGTNPFTHEKPRYRKKKPAHNAFAVNENAVNQVPEAPAPASAMQQELNAWNIAMPMMVNDVDNTIATNKAAIVPFNNKPFQLMMPDSGSNATVAAMPIQRKRSSLWHWGVVTDAGFSRIAESKLFQLKGLLGQDKYLAADIAYRSVRDSGSLLNFSSSASTVAKKASPIQPDLSFSVGLFVQRALSPRLKVSLGVQYTYMSVNTQVGQKVNAPLIIDTDSSSSKVVQEYYKLPGYVSVTADPAINGITAGYQAQGQKYVSDKHRYRFQYIEIPLMVNWQINKGRRLPPVMLEGGVSISRLLSVDALHFEGIKGVYYEDKSLFNKTQFNFVTGLSVGLLQKSKHPLWIGPNLRYALNGLVKREVSTGQYMWSAGISVKMLLGRL